MPDSAPIPRRSEPRTTNEWMDRARDLHNALDDLLNWVEHRKGKIKSRYPEAEVVARAREALEGHGDA